MENYTHKFTGLSIDQISELVRLFGEACHNWDKVRGFASVDFETEEDFHNWEQGFEFETD